MKGIFEGLGSPVAFAPFLDQFAERLNHQYRLTFLAAPEKKATYLPCEARNRGAQRRPGDRGQGVCSGSQIIGAGYRLVPLTLAAKVHRSREL